MLIHHLKAGAMTPPLVDNIVMHVFLVETSDGLVLVDSGLGTGDYADHTRMGPGRKNFGVVMDPANAVINQLPGLGFSADQVGHVVLTHLDFDHAGGLSDFPDATVHVTAAEHSAALVAPDWNDKFRYSRKQWIHGPHFQTHEGRGDLTDFAGLTGHEVLPGITLIPMPGHSRGHAAVAVTVGDHTYVHAGDAVFDASSYATHSPSGEALSVRRGIRRFEQVIGRDRQAIKANHLKLAELDQRADVTVVPAHDDRILRDLQAG